MVVSVVGGTGGVGASTFAAALAAAAGRSTLVDCDPVGGGVDVLLGIESVVGARWSGLRLDGGFLDPALLEEGLPRWNEVGVLAADAGPAAAIEQVVGAAAELGPVVLDVPRWPGVERDSALRCCQLCVVLVAARVAALVAARTVIAGLAAAPRLGAVLRRGDVPTAEASRVLGIPLLGVVPALDGSDVSPRIPRQVERVAAGVFAGASP